MLARYLSILVSAFYAELYINWIYFAINLEYDYNLHPRRCLNKVRCRSIDVYIDAVS